MRQDHRLPSSASKGEKRAKRQQYDIHKDRFRHKQKGQYWDMLVKELNFSDKPAT